MKKGKKKYSVCNLYVAGSCPFCFGDDPMRQGFMSISEGIRANRKCCRESVFPEFKDDKWTGRYRDIHMNEIKREDVDD